MKIIIIDNYDSFTYNLFQYVAVSEPDTEVYRNDQITLEEIELLAPDKIIISPGPGSPDDPKYFGVCKEVILTMSDRIPILGVCLGHQGIANIFGANITIADKVMHGKTSTVFHNFDPIFKGVNEQFKAMRYHSLIIEPSSLPNSFNQIAWTNDGIIMGIKHSNLPLYGLQFHPESIGTPDGQVIINNFLNIGQA